MRLEDDPPGSGPQPLASQGDDEPAAAEAAHPPLALRIVALIEVLLCSDIPTQTALAATFGALGYGPYGANGDLRAGFVVTLSLLDTALLVGLMLFFLYAHGERPRDVFLGRRPVSPEARYGVPLIFVALTIGIIILATIQRYLPSLHTVEKNPLQAMIRTPRDAWLFAFVVVVAGGVREELQRAFLLHRFDVWLGGMTVGVVTTSLAFGYGHNIQGMDAAIATGTLGAFWGIVYWRRRSAVAPVVSHSGFNLLQIVQFLATGR
jgi:membrane protease YdiL (CAAX protease family)